MSPCHHHVLEDTPRGALSHVIRHYYQDYNLALAERFIRVEFRDEDRLAYRWDGVVGEIWSLKQRVGGILRHGFKLGRHVFEFLAYSMSSVRKHYVWFVPPFLDAIEGYVVAESIRSSLGAFSKLLQTPNKYVARIVQLFTATDCGVKILGDQ